MGDIKATNLGKAYRLYPNKWSRLLEWILPIRKRRHKLNWILQKIDFYVSSGESVGVIGVNGAGKSTLLKLITGSIQPTTGSVNMGGRVSALLELGIGFHLDFSGRQNVFLAGYLQGLQESEIRQLMPEIEAFAEIGEYLEMPVRTYSTGMQVRLAFAVATAIRPDILIVDEALSVGDSYFQHKCFSRIRKFQELGTTLFFVSHDLAAVRVLCSKTMWINKGVIHKFGETKEVLDAYATEQYAKQQEDVSFYQKSDKKDGGVDNKQKRDCRLDFINNSNLRNDIEVFEFKKETNAWGNGLIGIISATLQDANGNSLSWIVGGEEVILVIDAKAKQTISKIIVGFLVKDRLGQNIFGDNTYITNIDKPVTIKNGSKVRTKFHFLMPILPQGKYAITTAIVSGTQKEHEVHDWVDDALFFESHNGISVNGLVGVPMHQIEIIEVN